MAVSFVTFFTENEFQQDVTAGWHSDLYAVQERSFFYLQNMWHLFCGNFCLYTEYGPEISIADVLNCAGTYIGLLARSNLTHEKLTSFQSGAVSDFRTAATVQARDHCDVRSWPKSYLVTQAWKVSAGKCRTQSWKDDHCKWSFTNFYMHALIGFFNVTYSIHQVLVISAVFCRPYRQSWPFRTTKVTGQGLISKLHIIQSLLPCILSASQLSVFFLSHSTGIQ
jgi:hypothetical protein